MNKRLDTYVIKHADLRCANEDLFVRFSRFSSGPLGLVQGRVLRADVLKAKPQPEFGREIMLFPEVRRMFGPAAVATEADIFETIFSGELSKRDWNFFLLPDCVVWVHYTGGHPVDRWFLLAHRYDIEYGAPAGSLVFHP